MKVKHIAMLLVIVMIAAMFAGCGTAQSGSVSADEGPAQTASVSSGAASSQPETEPTAEPEENPAYPLVDELTTLTMLVNYSASYLTNDIVANPEDFPFTDTLEELTNVHIDYSVISSPPTFVETLPVIIASGEVPDMIQSGHFYPGGVIAGVEDGAYLNLYPYLEEYAPDYWALLNEHESSLMMATLDTGVIGAFYMLREGGAPTSGLAVRQDWMDALNIESPTTIDEFETMLTAFKTEYDCDSAYLIHSGLQLGSSIVGGYGTSGFTTGTNPQQYSLGYYQVDGKVHFSPVEEGFRKYIETMNRWYENGLITKDFASITNTHLADDYLAYFYSDDAGVIFAKAANISTIEGSMADENAKIGSLVFPVENKGDTYHFVDYHYLSANSTAVVSADCEHPELAISWLNCFYKDDLKYTINFGEEGVSYNMVNGKVELTDAVLNNEWDAPAAIALNCFNTAGKCWPGLQMEELENIFLNDNAVELIAKASEGDSDYTCPNISVSTENLDEYKGIYADVSTYCDENIAKFITGDRPMSEWGDFVESLKGMDVERMVEIYQEAYDDMVSRIA